MGASVNFICSKAGLSRGALYSNFADKDELFAALDKRRAEKIRSRLVDGAAGVAEARDALEHLRIVLGGSDTEELQWDIINKQFVIHALRNEHAKALAR